MRKIKPEHHFFACNGVVLKSKEDLLDLLKNINENSFHHHVNAERNDFANWTKDVLKDKKLAKKLNHTQNVDEMIKALEESLHLKKSKKKTRKNVISELVSAIKNG